MANPNDWPVKDCDWDYCIQRGHDWTDEKEKQRYWCDGSGTPVRICTVWFAHDPHWWMPEASLPRPWTANGLTYCPGHGKEER